MDLCGGHPQKLLSSPKFKTLYLVRHAQGIHNVVLEEKRGIDEIGDVHLSPKLFDAPLSPKGVQQVSEQHKQILESGLLNTIELVITSPLRRLWERPEKEIAVVSHGIFLQQTLCALHEKVTIPLEDSLLTRLIIRFLKLINQSLVNLSVLTCN
ncbi:hypothetical protein DY000_02054628 [Brassica cretica]|uniref:Phosphoglycerate mutase-like protein n=1 Tax=Brassica cretica TaxID=69181 RepID=A0ABQ7A9Z4_BRACR|nr:hypothetical protein DY000_02054628 [Brassica cretica]